MTQKITTFLMFEGQAEAAMDLYLSVFRDARIVRLEKYGPDGPGTPGSVVQAVFEIAGQQFMCIDSYVHHEFGFTPAMSLFVNCDSIEELDRLYAELSRDGAVLMEPGTYDFAQRFTWISDRFGVSWQLIVP